MKMITNTAEKMSKSAGQSADPNLKYKQTADNEAFSIYPPCHAHLLKNANLYLMNWI